MTGVTRPGRLGKISFILRPKTDSAGQLHETRTRSAGKLPERSVRLRARCRIKLGAGIHARELRVVERVVGFSPDFQGRPLFDSNRPEDTHVPVIRAGSVEDGPIRITDVTRRREETQLVLKNALNVCALFASVGLQVSRTRWPSPPPVRSTPFVVEKLRPVGAPLIKVAIPEKRQLSKSALTRN